MKFLYKLYTELIKPRFGNLFCKHDYQFLEILPTNETHWEDDKFQINSMDFDKPGHIFLKRYKCAKCGKIKEWLINDRLVG